MAAKIRLQWLISTFESCMVKGGRSRSWFCHQSRKNQLECLIYIILSVFKTLGKYVGGGDLQKIASGRQVSGWSIGAQYEFLRAPFAVDTIAVVVQLARNALTIGKRYSVMTLCQECLQIS